MSEVDGDKTKPDLYKRRSLGRSTKLWHLPQRSGDPGTPSRTISEMRNKCAKMQKPALLENEPVPGPMGREGAGQLWKRTSQSFLGDLRPLCEGVVEEKEITRHRDKCVSYLYKAKKRMEVLAKNVACLKLLFSFIMCEKQQHSE